MEQKTARLTVLIDPAKKKAFETLCAQQDVTPSQVVRRLIRDSLAHHGVSYTPSGVGGEELDPVAGPARSAAAGHRGTAKPRVTTKGSAKSAGAHRRS